uniref:non-specific serine/threonine protein kinase n=1 Tax=Kalanchoe fedtschenkoi TaxID=63787 RepID=A0A7N0VN48_KALFE
MKCFSFSYGEKKDEFKTTKSLSVKSNTSTFTENEMRRSGSGFNSQNISDTSMESVGRSSFPSFSQRSSDLKVFTFQELKTATKNFSRSAMLGEGGFGCVYRGLIKNPEDSTQKMDIAVKKLGGRGLQGHKEWVTEVNVLGIVEHPNLVKLVGYCADEDERGMQRLLIYEYMPNGSVEQQLFSRTLPPLPWVARLKVAHQSASGLAYLHEGMDFQIIFRDFKSSNILLDENWNAKLSDFGMARLGPTDGLSHVSTAIVGTMGYAAPEYLQTGHLTYKTDVWSYGVFIYELITGRRALDRHKPKSEQKLLEWVRPYLSDPKKFRLIIDPRLEGKYTLKSVQKLAIIANRCLVKNHKSRPKMSEVVEMINRIVGPSAGNVSPQLPLLKMSLSVESADGKRDSNKRSNSDLGASSWLSRMWTPKLLRSC